MLRRTSPTPSPGRIAGLFHVIAGRLLGIDPGRSPRQSRIGSIAPRPPSKGVREAERRVGRVFEAHQESAWFGGPRCARPTLHLSDTPPRTPFQSLLQAVDSFSPEPTTTAEGHRRRRRRVKRDPPSLSEDFGIGLSVGWRKSTDLRKSQRVAGSHAAPRWIRAGSAFGAGGRFPDNQSTRAGGDNGTG